MKALFSIVILLIVSSLHADEVASVGVVFKTGSVAVSMVRYGAAEKNQFLVKVDGVDAPINGKVLLLTKTGGGTGASYYVDNNEKNVLRAPAHGYFSWEVYAGSQTYKINQDEKLTKDFKATDLLTQYQEQKKK